MNQVVLTGRLTKDPELRETTGGKSVASFNLAVDKYGEGADFINCIAWGKSAENLCKYQSKGSQIALSGRIQTRTYDDAKGNKQYITEIVADSIEFLGTKKETIDQELPQKIILDKEPFKDFGKKLSEAGVGELIQDSDLPF